MGWWSNLFGSDNDKAIAQIQQETETIERLGRSLSLADDKYTEEIQNYVKQNRDFLRVSGRVLPTDVYSRANGILDLIVRFIGEHVAEKGLSNEQRFALKGTLTQKLPELMRSYVDLRDEARTPERTMLLTDGLILVQQSMLDLRRLALEGSLSDSVRFDAYTKQLMTDIQRDSTPDDLANLFKN